MKLEGVKVKDFKFEGAKFLYIHQNLGGLYENLWEFHAENLLACKTVVINDELFTWQC